MHQEFFKVLLYQLFDVGCDHNLLLWPPGYDSTHKLRYHVTFAATCRNDYEGVAFPHAEIAIKLLDRLLLIVS